jgi:putative ABC transport system permease protein
MAWHEMNFMDIESYRECFGYFTAKDQTVALSETQETALTTEEDDLFGAFDVVEDTELNMEEYDVEAMQEQTERIVTDVNLDEGAYNLIAVKLKPDVSVPDGQTRLEQVLEDTQLDLKILTWKKAAGEVAQFATMTQGALYVFVLFIFFVAVIIIMNTLSMAAIERAGEIGMMRAIGARKAFIRKMFFVETLLLSAIFGGLGIVIGVFVVWGIDAMNIATTGNEIMNLLFGADTVHPVVNLMGIVSGVIQLAIVTLLAMIYPIRVATKITPLEAISRE